MGRSDRPDSTEFIVVGGGSAGSVTAARLAQAGFHTVLVESGPRDLHPLIHVPAGVRYLHGNAAVTRADTATTGAKANDRTMAWPHGRVLGGSGSINGMIFSRGTAADFDGWAARGCDGWGWEDVLPSFKSMETFRGPTGPTRGTDGPLPVELPRIRFPVTADFIRAAEARGHSPRADLNDGSGTGVGEVQMNRNGRLRASSARAFLPAARRTGRLTVLTGAEVTGLLLDPASNGVTCRGITYRMGGTDHRLAARREVILSAGAIDTPALLMRAGIGPADDLQALGITPLVDAPEVGANLQDHHATRLSFRLSGVTTINDLARPPRLWGEALRWLTTGRGVLTTGVTAAQVYLTSRPGLPSPDICLLFSPSSFDADRYGALERQPGCSVTVSICRPQSRGRLTLDSADPAARPRMDAGHFTDPQDMETMLTGIAEARAILSGHALAPVMVGETAPGTQVTGDALEAHVRATSGTMFHYCGTCRMGSDPDAVVDPRLRVRGTTNLRIADASIMPVITSGNTNAPTMMIGEHGARMIAADHGVFHWSNR